MSPIELTPEEHETLPWSEREKLLAERMTAWLASLKKGDWFAYCRGRDIEIHTVDRLTKTQLIATNGSRFRRKDGIRLGSASRWVINPVTDEMLAKLKARENWSRLESLVSQVRLSDEEAAAMLETLDSLREKQAAQQGEGAQK